MPEFSGQVRHANQNFPVLDLTDGASQFNQTGKSPVKGIGVFSDLPSRRNITQRYRTKGYLAVVDTTAYVYTGSSVDDSDWEQDGNWAGLSATNGIPSGGSTNNVLAKTSDDNYLADWTGDPVFNSTTLNSSAPRLVFSSTSSSETQDGDTLGIISFKGVGTNDTGVRAGKIVFSQEGAAGADHVPSAIQFYTSTDSSQDLAFSINNEKVAIFAGTTSPTAVTGGMYYDETTNSFYLGINQ